VGDLNKYFIDSSVIACRIRARRCDRIIQYSKTKNINPKICKTNPTPFNIGKPYIRGLSSITRLIR
jgi:hypothetical protein